MACAPARRRSGGRAQPPSPLGRAPARLSLRPGTMRVLVTGGAGFIGSALARHLVLDLGASVLGVDKLTYAGDRRSLAACEGRPGFSFLQADICDAGAVAAAFG